MRKYLHLFIKMNAKLPIVTACCFVMLFMMAIIADSTVGKIAGNYYQYSLVKNCKGMFQYTLFSEEDDYTGDTELGELEKRKQFTLNQIEKNG